MYSQICLKCPLFADTFSSQPFIDPTCPPLFVKKSSRFEQYFFVTLIWSSKVFKVTPSYGSKVTTRVTLQRRWIGNVFRHLQVHVKTTERSSIPHCQYARDCGSGYEWLDGARVLRAKTGLTVQLKTLSPPKTEAPTLCIKATKQSRNTLSDDIIPKKKCILHCKYFRYLHKTNTTVFILLSDIKWAELHCWQCASAKE